MQVEIREDTISNISSHYGVKADKLRRHYKNHVSGFKDWNQKSHYENYLLYPQNISCFISIDEVALSQGEMYTFVTSKAGKGKKGSMLASIKGTRSQDIISVLEKLPLAVRNSVKALGHSLGGPNNLCKYFRNQHDKFSIIWIWKIFLKNKSPFFSF